MGPGDLDPRLAAHTGLLEPSGTDLAEALADLTGALGDLAVVLDDLTGSPVPVALRAGWTQPAPALTVEELDVDTTPEDAA